MNKFFILSTALFLIGETVLAQHQQHNIGTTQSANKLSKQKVSKRIGPVVEYHLYVKDTIVKFTGKKRPAIAINGQIPAPTLRFTEGDSAVIYVHNLMHEEISVHWHGVLLPNEEDGVPFLNTEPIMHGMTHTFRFRVIQSGTLWYHSHTMVQEQAGLYGPLVFYPAEKKQIPKNEEVLQISDWRDERPNGIMRSLKRRNEWYAIKKKGVQSWGEAIVKGHFSDKVQMEWGRMPGADVSDVYYDRILMQGQPVQTFEKYKKGDSVRLRVINGSAATYFWLQYAGGKITVVAADGNDVKPVMVDKLLIATAETYDLIIKIPEDGQYEFRATAQDITKTASAFFGSGTQIKAKDIPPLDYMVLMNEMNKMTWLMKGMGMKMKMGLYMKMPEMSMTNMQDMSDMNMENMNMNDTAMNMINMNHPIGDTMKMDMNNMNHPAKDSASPDPMRGMDHTNMNMGDPAKSANDTTMQEMDHSKMPGMKAPASTTKKTTSSTTKTSKTSSKKPAVKKATVKKAPVKKKAPKKPAPKKKDAMERMDHGKMKMQAYQSNNTSNFFIQASYSLNKPDISAPIDTTLLSVYHANNTVPKTTGTSTDTSGQAIHNLDSVKSDTTPPAKSRMTNMRHRNINMQGMQSGMQMKNTDTSRSYMLQTMMPRTPMTGYDFPPGNENDKVLSYDMLRSDTSTTLPANRPWREIEFTLSGNMQRYVWSINGKTLSEQDDKVLIRKGENIRLVFTNATMMEHPMHLHGHFFRVINNQGNYAPMKHTFNINPMAVQVIEFAATEEKDWFLHCHILYHMVAGMATIISYEGTESEVQKAYQRGFRQFKREHGGLAYPWANASFHTQGTFGTIVFSGRKFQIDQDWKWNWEKSIELETKFQYFLDKRQFFSAFIGGEYEKNNMRKGKEVPDIEKNQIATVGLIYTLPFFINIEGRVDHRGKLRFQAIREDLPLTTRTRLDFYWNTNKEYGIEARYIVAKYLALSANYDSDFGWGAGISIIY